MAGTTKKAPAKKLSQVEQLMVESRNELNEEKCKSYKAAIKMKLRALNQAELLVKNIKREIKDMEIAISDELS